MYCHKPLGANEAVGRFPVGRRLAFDAAKGRLWVVCRSCERWNLTPLETRWEAVEECERAFRDTRLRVSTENIGMARMPDGLDLVRVGNPLLPELAAWRYGDQFGRRRRRAIALGGGVTVAAGALVAGATAAGISVISLSGLATNLPHLLRYAQVVRLRTDDGRLLRLRGTQVATTQLVPSHSSDGSFQLLLKVKGGSETFSGDEAVRHARRLIPAVNSSGGNRTTVSRAVDELQRSRSAEEFLARFIRRNYYPSIKQGAPVANLPAPLRLALEMALHEEVERRALEGELAELETAWRDAEEIAAIADNMFIPLEVERKLAQLKQASREPPQ
jgi:hypothetical protein